MSQTTQDDRIPLRFLSFNKAPTIVMKPDFYQNRCKELEEAVEVRDEQICELRAEVHFLKGQIETFKDEAMSILQRLGKRKRPVEETVSGGPKQKKARIEFDDDDGENTQEND